MAHSHRLGPPDPVTGTIVRTRLLGRLARRWERRVMTVVAGPGFGKTSLLVASLADAGPTDQQAWVSCGPSDADAASLSAAVAEALGVGEPYDLDAVVRSIWLRAPARVCLFLDDVHEVPPGSSGAAWLQRLIDELPGNAHLVMSARVDPPVPLARVAGRRQLERLVESDLLFDADEMSAFAAARDVDASVLASTGGWPALAELAAAAADDLLFEYVWDEVLGRIGVDRTEDLARLALAGGGDDDVVAAIGCTATSVGELVSGIPLVERRAGGWVQLHPLWMPVLRSQLEDPVANDVRRRAAATHRGAGRFEQAIRLFAEAGAGDEVLATVRAAALDASMRLDSASFHRWYGWLSPAQRATPVGRFALGIAVAARVPVDAIEPFADARAGFRAIGDVDAEVAVLHEHGLVLWWANDVVALLDLHLRAGELAAAGSEEAAVLRSIGEAGVAHIVADSAGVLGALDGLDERRVGSWHDVVTWFRHVAHRREGDLERAELELSRFTSAAASGRPGPAVMDPQHLLARLRTDWLRGRVDHVADEQRSVVGQYRQAEQRYLYAETALELAARLAWLGERDEAGAILSRLAPTIPDLPGSLVHVLWCIASAAISVFDGAEDVAHGLLVDQPVAAPGRPDNWYWLDRGAVALVHVLLPEHRRGWEDAVRSPTHRPGLTMASMLESVRDGRTDAMASFVWPDPGIARAHFPITWLSELVAAGHAVGNPAPGELVDAVGAPIVPALSRLATRATVPVADAASRLAERLASVATIDVSVLGPLRVSSDGVMVDHPDLRRRRVRELLCFLVAHERVRRDAVADALWPTHADPRHNLRVTLSYLRGVLGDERGGDATDPVAHVRTDHDTVTLVRSPRLRCDVWELVELLDAAERAEERGEPELALASYGPALRLWHGSPYEELADLDWARDEQTRLRRRYVAAAVRAGELHHAVGDAASAVTAGERALSADSSDERAYRLVARAHLSTGDVSRARRVLEACGRMLDELGVTAGAETDQLMDVVGLRRR